MVQVRNKQDKELALEAHLEAKEKVQVGVSKQKEFHGKEKGKHQLALLQQRHPGSASPVPEGFSSPSPVLPCSW